MSQKRNSIFLQQSRGIFKRIGLFFAKSVFWKRICLYGYPRLDQCFENGFWKGLLGRETGRQAWQYRFRRAGMRARERSLLLRTWERGIAFLLSSAVSSYGAFSLLLGSFLLAIRLFGERTDLLSALLLPGVLLLTAFPLLHEERSMAQALLQSRFFSAFLFSFCALEREAFQIHTKGKDHKLLTLLLAFLFGVSSIWISPLYWIVGGLICLLLTIFFAVPEVLFILLFAALPFLEYTEHPTLCLLVLALIAMILWLGKLIRGRRTVRFGILDFFVFLFLLSFLCAGIGTGGGSEALWAGTSKAALLSLFFPFVSLFKRGLWRRRAMIAIESGGLFCATVGIFQYLQGKAELAWVDLSRFSDIGGRVTGCFSNPNILAVYLLLLLPIALSGTCSKENNKPTRAFFCICFCSELICLILTWSRGAWLGAILSLFLFIIFTPRIRAFLPFLLVPIMGMLSFLPRNIVNRFQSIGSLSESSIRYRLYVWKGVGRMIAANPAGIGMGNENFSVQYLPYAVSGTETVIHTHQIFLQILCELGVVGFLLFLSILILLLLCFTQAENKNRYREERIGGACALLGSLVMGLFDHIWYHYGIFTLFWIIAALVCSHSSALSERGGRGFESGN